MGTYTSPFRGKDSSKLPRHATSAGFAMPGICSRFSGSSFCHYKEEFSIQLNEEPISSQALAPELHHEPQLPRRRKIAGPTDSVTTDRAAVPASSPSVEDPSDRLGKFQAVPSASKWLACFLPCRTKKQETKIDTPFILSA